MNGKTNIVKKIDNFIIFPFTISLETVVMMKIKYINNRLHSGEVKKLAQKVISNNSNFTVNINFRF